MSIDALEEMTHLFFLGLQVTKVVGISRDFDGHSFHDAQAIAIDTDNFLGVIRQQPNLANAEIQQYLCPMPIMP